VDGLTTLADVLRFVPRATEAQAIRRTVPQQDEEVGDEMKGPFVLRSIVSKTRIRRCKMRGKWILLGSCVVILSLALAVGLSQAQGPEPEGEVSPQGDVSIAATVGSKFSYQGVLKENGSPVSGSRDMIFRLYSDNACAIQVGSDIVESSVPVTDGLFSVELDVTQSYFNGQGLWLNVEVGGTEIGCQEIMPVPYALSLRPGAVIGDTSSYVGLNHGRTLLGPVMHGTKCGVYATSEGTASTWTYYGVYAKGTDAAIYGDGDVKQSLAGNGLVKAAVYVNCNNHDLLLIPIRDFNNVSSTAISAIVGSGDGECTLDFGFNVSDRFWVATAVGASASDVTCQLGNTNRKLDCFRHDAAGAGSDGEIMVLVY